MSSFKKADGIIDSIQKQATGLRTLDGSAIEDFLSIAGYEDPQGGGGDSGVLSEIFPVCAKVTFVVSGVEVGHFPTFTNVGTSTGVLLVSYDDEYGWLFSTDEFTVNNGTSEYYLVTLSESGELDYDKSSWDVSVSGGAELGEDEENAWVMVSGDCTITATKK